MLAELPPRHPSGEGQPCARGSSEPPDGSQWMTPVVVSRPQIRWVVAEIKARGGLMCLF